MKRKFFSKSKLTSENRDPEMITKYPFRDLGKILLGLQQTDSLLKSDSLKGQGFEQKHKSTNASVHRFNEAEKRKHESFLHYHKTQVTSIRKNYQEYAESPLNQSNYYSRIIRTPNKLKKSNKEKKVHLRIGNNICKKFKKFGENNLQENTINYIKMLKRKDYTNQNNQGNILEKNIKKIQKCIGKKQNKLIDISRYVNIYQGSRARVYEYFCYFEVILRQCRNYKTKFVDLLESAMHLQQIPILAQDIQEILQNFIKDGDILTFEVFLKLVKQLQIMEFQRNINQYLRSIFKNCNIHHISYWDLQKVLSEKMEIRQSQSQSKQIYDKLKKSTATKISINQLQNLCSQDYTTCKLFYMLSLREDFPNKQVIQLKFG